MIVARPDSRRGRAWIAAAALAAVLGCGGCASLSSWIPDIPTPSFGWLTSMFGGKKLAPVPDFPTTANTQIVWQVALGKSAPGLAPAITANAIYAANSSGSIVRVDPATGAVAWRVETARKLAAGVGADATLLVVGTDKGDVFAYDTTNGNAKWQSKVSSEVLGPPRVADGIVVVWTGDGRIHGLAAADGKTKWVYQRTNPPLTIRNYAGGTTSRGGLFSGTAGGKLLALDLSTGTIGWEANVATPKGSTELERIADVTSLPIVEERQVCAVAYQGRVACFEILRGEVAWTRDISSLTGLAVDNRFMFVADDAGNVHALDKATGASAWKQDKLAPRHVGGAQIAGDFLLVQDPEGFVYLLDRSDGNLVGRAPTDGTPATAQPALSGGNAVWQSQGGTLYAVTGR